MYGATILPPCVNHSKYETIIKGKTIYLGFLLIRSFEALTAKRIVKERLENGPFKSLDDFIDRLTISIEQLAILIKLNAFKFTQQNKRELLWEAHLKVSHIPVEAASITLFKTKKKVFKIPTLSCSALEDSFDEMEYLGFTLQNPFRLLVSRFRYRFFANDLYRYIGSIVAIHGYYVTAKNTRTSKGDIMFFGTFIDVKGYFIDTVHFPPVARKYPFRGSGVYLLVGKVVEEFDAISLEITRMEKLAIIQDPRYAEPSKKRRVC
jgi:DNA polymerase-3 subunit alpha